MAEDLQRVLLAHNYYGSAAPSGENMVVKLERDMLRRRGHSVGEFTRHSDGIRSKGVRGLLIGGLSTPWNFNAAREIRLCVEHLRSDLVHVHNTFPLISPAIFRAIAGRAARVLTLHNYRIVCPGGLPFRDVAVCMECIDGRSSWPSIKHGCYRQSRLATLPLAVSASLHRVLGTWVRHVDAFVAFSNFQRDVMINAGLPRELIHIKPNFFPGKPASRPMRERLEYVVYAGRLSPEKGVESLIRAWLSWGSGAPELRILGDGPLGAALKDLASTDLNTPIRFFGQVAPSDVEKHVAGAKLLVIPSICFEGFPMVIREAFAFGTPVAASDLGPLPSIVRNGISGILLPVSDPEGIRDRIASILRQPESLEILSMGARSAFESEYTEDANYKKLLDIYAAASIVNRERRHRG